jgi:hypothetical protein
MTEGFGTSWLPASALRAQAAEEQQDNRAEREAQRAKAAEAEAARDRAIAAYMARAAAEGQDISAMDAATGNIGRTLAEVLAGPMSEVADRVPKEFRDPVTLVDAPVRRSAPADPDGTIDRAMLAKARRQREADERRGAELLEEAAARHKPTALEDTWAGWRQR